MQFILYESVSPRNGSSSGYGWRRFYSQTEGSC